MNAYEEMLALLRRYHSNADGARLAAEILTEGFNVAADFVAMDVGAPWVWSSAMEAFYRNTDAFVYELLVWHHKPWRIALRERVGKLISNVLPEGGHICCIGDGIGFDSVSIAAKCKTVEVTSYELPGASSAFAAKLFEDSRLANVRQVSSREKSIAGKYDLVLCLHVLEHLPDPIGEIEAITESLKVGGHALLAEAFGVVDPGHPTHLAANLRYAGRTIGSSAKAGLGFRSMVPGWVYHFQKGYRAGGRDLGVRARLTVDGAMARIRFRHHYGSGVDLREFVSAGKQGQVPAFSAAAVD